MKLNTLKQRQNLSRNIKLNEYYLQFDKLIDELLKKEIPDDVVRSINREIDQLNAIPDSDHHLKSQFKRAQKRIITMLEKELKIVPKNHYQNTWLAIGLSSFGIPLGVVFGILLENMAFIGVGLPIGLAIGLAIGYGMDKNAVNKGRQLDINIKY